jgi:hypothetical protein
VLHAPSPPIVVVRPAAEIRTASPVNEVTLDGGLAATLVGETPSWEYVLVWSPKGIVVRPNLACDTQESDLVLAGDRLAHVCFEGSTNTVLTATLHRTTSVPQLHTSAFVVLAGHGSLIAGSAGRTLSLRPRGEDEAPHVHRVDHRARRRRRPDPRRPK